jgi:hypothetical protein
MGQGPGKPVPPRLTRSRPMAVHAANPAPGPIDLETLIDRATRPLPRRLPDPPPLPRAPPAARIDPPRAIVLVTTVATCQSCGPHLSYAEQRHPHPLR